MKEADFDMICGWHIERNMPIPPRDIYPVTTYIAELDGVPILSCSLFLMNAPGCAKVENLIGSVNNSVARREAVPMIFRHIESIAKAWGYSRLVLFSYEKHLKEKYEGLGYTRTLENVTTFSKILGD